MQRGGAATELRWYTCELFKTNNASKSFMSHSNSAQCECGEIAYMIYMRLFVHYKRRVRENMSTFVGYQLFIHALKGGTNKRANRTRYIRMEKKPVEDKLQFYYVKLLKTKTPQSHYQ